MSCSLYLVLSETLNDTNSTDASARRRSMQQMELVKLTPEQVDFCTSFLLLYNPEYFQHPSL